MLASSHALTALSRALRWRVLVYLLLLAAAAALAVGERFHPNPAPPTSPRPIVDPD